MSASNEDVDPIVQGLARQFEAVLEFGEHCRHLSDDALAEQAAELSATAKSLFIATMYELAARARGSEAAE